MCASAPFASFIPQRLGFIGGSFNNKGSVFEMKLSCICVGESPLFFFFYFRMVISALGVKSREEESKRDNTAESKGMKEAEHKEGK